MLLSSWQVPGVSKGVDSTLALLDRILIRHAHRNASGRATRETWLLCSPIGGAACNYY